MNPTKSAAPYRKSTVALVDNDPRAVGIAEPSHRRRSPRPTWCDGHFRRRSDRTLPEERRQSQLACIDMSMEGLQDRPSCQWIRLMDRHLPILGITSFINSYRSRLMEAGAQGLIGKEDRPGQVKAIERLWWRQCYGGIEPPPPLANVRIDARRRLHRGSPCGEEQSSPVPTACRVGDRRMTDILSTVRKHMQGILKKLNCKTACQAVALWVRSHAR